MAFKIIRDFVENPLLQVACDRSCGMHASCTVEPGTEENPEMQVGFLNALVQAGWKITAFAQVCPEHVKRERDGAPLVLVAPGATSYRAN